MSEQMLPMIVAGALFVGVLALGLLTLLLLRAGQMRRIRRRMVLTDAAEPETATGERGALEGVADQGRRIEKLVDTENEAPRLLVQAGWRGAEQRTLYYVAQALLPVIGVALVMVAWLFRGPEASGLHYLMYLLMALFIGVLAPRYWLRKRAAARRERIAAEVPLFIHLLVLLFGAGLSMRQALASLINEGKGTLPELNREFAIVTRQLDAGGDTVEVLKNLEDALQVSDLANVLGVLRQVDRYGGEIRESLLETLSVLEDRRAMSVREMVNKMSGRMTVVMVLFFFPALLVFVAGPAFMSIITSLGNIGG